MDVWHADASGAYSGVQQNVGQTFMRGIQKTAVNGLALFKTVCSGWYQGRTVHMHLMVHVGGNVAHTGQLYFPDTLTHTVYTKAPLQQPPGRSTPNAKQLSLPQRREQVARDRARGRGRGYVALIVMGVHR